MKVMSVSEAIEEAIKKSRKLKEGVIRGNWERITKRLSIKSEPLWIKDGVLYVLVEDSIYLHQMSINKDMYIKKIAEVLNTDFVKDIRFKISKISKKEEKKHIFEEKKEEKVEFISEIKNLSLEEKIEILKKESKEREKSLKDKGYKSCMICGTMFLGEEKICKICSLKKNMDKVLEAKNDNE